MFNFLEFKKKGCQIVSPFYLTKHIFYLREEILLPLFGIFGIKMTFLFQGQNVFLLFGGEILRDVDLCLDKLISGSGVVQPDNAPLFHPEQLTRLSARFNFHFGFSFQSGDFHFGTQDGIGNAEHQIVIDVVALPFKMFMLLLFDQHDQIPRFSATDSRIPLPAKGDVISVRHTRANAPFHLLVLLNTSVPGAFSPRVPDDTAFAATVVTRLHVYNLPEHGPRDLPDLSHSITGRAGFEILFTLGAGSVTAAARGVLFHFEGLLDPCGDLFEGELHPQFHIGSRPAGSTAPSALGAATECVPSKDVAAENITEMTENIFKIGISEIGGTTKSAPVDTRMAILIITLSFLRIPKHIIRFRRLLEFLSGSLIALIPVGMILHRQLTVGLFQLLFVCISVDT